MSLPPEKIGDKGQRFQIKYSAGPDASDDERCLGYAGTADGAEQMAAAWRTHPRGYDVWVVDRGKPQGKPIAGSVQPGKPRTDSSV